MRGNKSKSGIENKTGKPVFGMKPMSFFLNEGTVFVPQQFCSSFVTVAKAWADRLVVDLKRKSELTLAFPFAMR